MKKKNFVIIFGVLTLSFLMTAQSATAYVDVWSYDEVEPLIPYNCRGEISYDIYELDDPGHYWIEIVGGIYGTFLSDFYIQIGYDINEYTQSCDAIEIRYDIYTDWDDDVPDAHVDTENNINAALYGFHFIYDFHRSNLRCACYGTAWECGFKAVSD